MCFRDYSTAKRYLSYFGQKQKCVFVGLSVKKNETAWAPGVYQILFTFINITPSASLSYTHSFVIETSNFYASCVFYEGGYPFFVLLLWLIPRR